MYSENVGVDGLNHVKEFKLPYNATAGKWKLVVKDTATGVRAEKEFDVR